MIQKVVINKKSKIRKRSGYSDFQNDGSFNSSEEEIVEKEFDFIDGHIYKYNEGTETFDDLGENPTPVYGDNLVRLAAKDVEVTEGIPSGSYINTHHWDGLYYVIQEDNVTPGFDIIFVFFDPKSSFDILIFAGRYEGHESKNVKLQVYNDDTSGWEDITSFTQDLPHSIADYQKRFSIIGTLPDYYNDNSEIRIRIYQTGPGNVTYHLYVDQIVMAKRV